MRKRFELRRLYEERDGSLIPIVSLHVRDLGRAALWRAPLAFLSPEDRVAVLFGDIPSFAAGLPPALPLHAVAGELP